MGPSTEGLGHQVDAEELAAEEHDTVGRQPEEVGQDQECEEPDNEELVPEEVSAWQEL